MIETHSSLKYIYNFDRTFHVHPMKFKFSCILISLLIGANLFAQEWHTDFSEASNLARKQNRPIILVFQGSDWCAPCIKLDREIWSSDEFKAYARDHFVMLKADFPKKSKNALPREQEEHNEQLAERYNTQGYFPYVVVLDDNGEVMGSTGYKKVSPSEYIEILESFIK